MRDCGVPLPVVRETAFTQLRIASSSSERGDGIRNEKVSRGSERARSATRISGAAPLPEDSGEGARPASDPKRDGHPSAAPGGGRPTREGVAPIRVPGNVSRKGAPRRCARPIPRRDAGGLGSLTVRRQGGAVVDAKSDSSAQRGPRTPPETRRNLSGAADDGDIPRRPFHGRLF